MFQRALGEFGRGDLAASARGMAQVAEQAEDEALVGRFGLDAPLAVVALGYQARALADLQLFEAADGVAKACAVRAAEVARPFTSIYPRRSRRVTFCSSRGAAAEAATCLTKAASLCDQAETDLMRPVAQSFLGAAEVALGMIAPGLEHLETAVKRAEAMGFLFQQPLRLALLADALAAAGRDEEAAQRTAEALALAASQSDGISIAAARRAATRAGR